MQQNYRCPDKETLSTIPRLPYFYVIRHTPSKKLYAGYHSYKANPALFMTSRGYKTSSKEVAKYPLDEYKILRIRSFETSIAARTYEFRFLKKVNAKDNLCFMNLSNSGSSGPGPRSLKIRLKISQGRSGKKASEETKRKLKEAWIRRRQNASVSVETREKMSIAHRNKPHPCKEKTSEERKRISLKLSNAFKGRNIIWKDKISKGLMGHDVSKETRKKISLTLKNKRDSSLSFINPISIIVPSTGIII
jgi:NUMOD3 motif